MIRILSVAVGFAILCSADWNAPGPHVTLEATHVDGTLERIPVQNPALCNEVIDAWRTGRIWTWDQIVQLRCADYDSFKPGTFAKVPQ